MKKKNTESLFYQDKQQVCSKQWCLSTRLHGVTIKKKIVIFSSYICWFNKHNELPNIILLLIADLRSRSKWKQAWSHAEYVVSIYLSTQCLCDIFKMLQTVYSYTAHKNHCSSTIGKWLDGYIQFSLHKSWHFSPTYATYENNSVHITWMNITRWNNKYQELIKCLCH